MPPNAVNNYVEQIRMDAVVQWLTMIHNAYPIVGILLVVMGTDIAVGLFAAVVTKTISSTISQKGMSRKVIMLLLVGLGATIEPYAGGIPLSKMVAMCFLVTEGISIVENSARAGVPIPKALYDVLQKLKNDEKASVPMQPSQTVTVNRASSVNIQQMPPVDAIDPNKTEGHDSGIHILSRGDEK